MSTRIIIPALLLAVSSALCGQSMIGLTKGQVETRVREEFREFHRDNMVVRQQFNYLKYVNRSSTRTWILHFSDQDICRISKMVCDYSEYNRALADLNSAFRKAGDSTWEYTTGSDTILVEVIRSEWYFTIREARKE